MTVPIAWRQRGFWMDQAEFRTLISAEPCARGMSVARGFLHALSLPYGVVTHARNRAYDLGLARSHRPSVPVVSVGNLTTGGTGKTPFVAFLANWFRKKGVHVALLSRGYRALPGKVNDEKLVLDRLSPDIPHLQNADRVASARRAVEEHGAELLLLDDGFQHRRLARDLDIVLIDALNPWGHGHLLPRGLLREPVSSLRRADLAVLTRADQCSPDRRDEIVARIAAIRGSDECVEVAYPPQNLVNACGESVELASLAGQPVLAFCGLGNPEGFRQTLQSEELLVRDFVSFPDHHHYTRNDLAGLEARALQSGVAALVTTEKDLVKIPRTNLGGRPLWAVRIGARILEGDPVLENHLQAILAATRP